MPSWSWKRRRVAQAAWDALSWILAIPLAVLLRYDFNAPERLTEWAVAAGAIAAIAYLAIGHLFHLYRGRYVVGSFDEVFGVALNSLIISLIGTIVTFVIPVRSFPRSAFVIGAGIALIMMLSGRFFWRAKRESSALKRTGARTLIYGAGDAGAQIVNLMLADREGLFQPIGFIDDAPSKRHLRRGGIRVLGTLGDLEGIVREQDVQVLLIAIAGITADQLLEIDRRCRAVHVKVQVIPTATEIAGGAVKLGDISDLTDEDLLGRRPINTDESQIREFITGKCVLITGAGGSIGSELARQLSRYEPARLLLLDRDESALHAVQLTLDGTGHLVSENLILADIRDASTVLRVFRDYHPELVFHAAALKHLPFLERFPDEAWKTNVLGTRNVLNAALDVSVQAFINISTDKAADPTSVLGYSKLITERLTAGANANPGASFVSVRFGNVLGSRGSVIETFRFQISKGGPITVTDRRMERYFMTIREAVHLVLQAAVLGRNGETLVLDMGRPVRILDIAEEMISRSGRAIEVVCTGLRPGEKLTERLTGSNEAVAANLHPLIAHCRVEPISLEDAHVVTNLSVSSRDLRDIATKS